MKRATINRPRQMSQFALTAIFALILSFLTLAASFAEVPHSEFVGNQLSSR